MSKKFRAFLCHYWNERREVINHIVLLLRIVCHLDLLLKCKPILCIDSINFFENVINAKSIKRKRYEYFDINIWYLNLNIFHLYKSACNAIMSSFLLIISTAPIKLEWQLWKININYSALGKHKTPSHQESDRDLDSNNGGN